MVDPRRDEDERALMYTSFLERSKAPAASGVQLSSFGSKLSKIAPSLGEFERHEEAILVRLQGFHIVGLHSVSHF